MAIDISQFRATYLEESFDGLETMEHGLLELGQGDPDPELINGVFRAIHSIKGGSGTYGFHSVGRLSHVMETLLDEVRGGERSIEPEIIDVLLAGVDVVRELLGQADAEDEEPPQAFREILDSLEALMGVVAEEVEAPSKPVEAAPSADGGRWGVRFTPGPELLTSGNDALRLLRCVQELGETQTNLRDDRLPPWSEFDPEVCYLEWELDVQGDGVAEDGIREVFEWVNDLAQLEVDAAPPASDSPPPSPESQLEASVADDPSAPGAAPPAKDAAARKRKSGSVEAGSIRVDIGKVDSLINMVGELVITQSMLSQVGRDFDPSMLDQLRSGLVQLERNTRELQESVMRIRMVPMSFAFGRIPRVVHDVSSKLGKQVRLDVSGEGTELDKTVMERLHDPLVHIVRNSLDHGLESPEDRVACGKPAEGVLSLNAYHYGGMIVIEVADDGRGLNVEGIRQKAIQRGLVAEDEDVSVERAAELIFHPGFSTAAQITDVSGRGVGMDVVRRNIDALGGSVSLRTEAGAGTAITIRLPLTLAILDGQTICVGEERYILPLNSIIETVQLQGQDVKRLAGGAEVFLLRSEYVRILRLADIFEVQREQNDGARDLVVVVEGGGQKIGLFVDELLAQQQIVIKSLETNYRKVDGVSGATILGDGSVALILDIAGLVRVANALGPQPGQGNAGLGLVRANSNKEG